jgi:hypothetical protein
MLNVYTIFWIIVEFIVQNDSKESQMTRKMEILRLNNFDS